VNGNYTYQRAKDRGTGNVLIGRPVHQVNAEVKGTKGPFQAGLSVNFVHQQYLDSLNTQVVNHRLIMNAQAGYFYKEKVRFGAEVRNVTNSQVVDSVGFPLPGRSYFGRVDVYF